MAGSGWFAAFAISQSLPHMKPMEWGLVEKDFESCDGALCDIYVQNATVDDWQAVIDSLRRTQFKLELLLDGQIVELPRDVSKLLFRHPSASCPSMYVHMASTTLNCHFFTHEEIEFDLDPRDMRPELLPGILEFLKLLGRATNKPVILAVENSPEAAIMRFEPAKADVEYVGPAFGS
jgi:hypothetical protein